MANQGHGSGRGQGEGEARGQKLKTVLDITARAKQALDRIAAAKANPEAVQAAVDELRANLDELAAAAEAASEETGEEEV